MKVGNLERRESIDPEKIHLVSFKTSGSSEAIDVLSLSSHFLLTYEILAQVNTVLGY